MICADFKKNIRDYMEDLVSESQHEEMRSHFQLCPPCRETVFMFGSFTSDLKKLAYRELPFDLASLVLKELEEPAALRSGRTHTLRWLGLSSFALAVIFILAGIGLARLKNFAKQNEPQLAAPIPQAAPPAEMKPPPEKPKWSVSLQPFHWHLIFPSAGERRTFLAKIHALRPAVQFESPAFLAASVNRDQLKELVLLMIEAPGVKMETLPPRAGALPEFQGEVRVSLFLRLAEADAAEEVAHWHLKFGLPNRFSFLDRLKENGIKPLLETSDLWIFEAPEEKVKAIRAEAVHFPGLILDSRPQTELSKAKYLVLYLQEG